MAIKIKRGDEFELPIKLEVNKEYPNISNIEMIEFFVGPFRKVYPEEVTYSAIDEIFRVPLKQYETFRFNPKTKVTVDCRIKFSNGDVRGVKPSYVEVVEASSEEVL